MSANMFENTIESYTVQDVFCTDLIKVEKIGPCARLTFAVRHAPDAGSDDQRLEYHIVARIIVPGDMLVTWGVELAQRPDLRPAARASDPGRELN